MCCLPRQQKCARESARAAQFEGPEIFELIAVRNVRIFGLPFSQSEQVPLRDLPFFCTIATSATRIRKAEPTFPSGAAPTESSASSAAENQGSKLVNYLILLTRIIIRQTGFQLAEKLLFTALLPFEAQPHERGNCLAHTGFGCLSVKSNICRQQPALTPPCIETAHCLGACLQAPDGRLG